MASFPLHSSSVLLATLSVFASSMGFRAVGFDVVIRRRDGAPLGSPEAVVALFKEAFENANFVVAPSGSWNGDFQGDGFAIEFYLGDGPVVREGRACLYGNFAKAHEPFSTLAEWKVEEAY